MTSTRFASIFCLALIAGSAVAADPADKHKAHHADEAASASIKKPVSAAPAASAASGMGMRGEMAEHCKEKHKSMGKHKKAMHDEHEHCEMMESSKAASAPGGEPMPGMGK